MPDKAEGTLAYLQTVWASRGIAASELRVDERGTLVTETVAETSEDLGELDSGTEALELGEPIGRGGTAVVRAARQRSLRRDVAVKVLRPEATGRRNVWSRFVQEARITGAVEHPNVVPVYDMGRVADGSPAIVMKRVEGQSWGALLRGRRVELDRHLEILQQVASVLHFAHSRGIIHRDVKPDNVMIGAFDEVYVVDWGSAVTLRADDESGLPRPNPSGEVVGTPAYMAPELAIGDADKVDERTDVYLLGSALYEVVTGDPPHAAPTVVEALAAAYESQPKSFPPDAPRGLVEICQRALAAEPADRFPDAAAFRAALTEYQRHRSSLLLADEAQSRLDELRQLLADSPGEEREAARLRSECRFGFAQALRIWADNQAAREGLQAALEAMIHHELERGSARTAKSLLAELPTPNPSLAERVEAAARREGRAERRLERLQQDIDPTVGERVRAVFMCASSLSWLGSMILCGALHRADSVSHLEMGLVAGAAALLIAAFAYWVPKHLLTITSVNRKLVAAMPLTLAAYAAVFPLSAAMQLSVFAGMVFVALIGASVWFALALSLDHRLWPAPTGLLAALPLMFALPDYFFEVAGVCGSLGHAGVAFNWMRS